MVAIQGASSFFVAIRMVPYGVQKLIQKYLDIKKWDQVQLIAFCSASEKNMKVLHSKKCNVCLPYVKHALNVRYKTYVKRMDRAPYV